MGRIKTILIVACVLFLFTTCDNFSVYESIRNEIASDRNVSVVSDGYYPTQPCIDASDSVKIILEKSLDVSTIKCSGSLADSAKTITFETTNKTNDTVILTPKTKWAADLTLGNTTASFYLKSNDIDGWPCVDITWTPEIIDKVIYVSSDTGMDNPTGSGSATKPFKNLIYALGIVYNLYLNKEVFEGYEIHLAQGSYYAQYECDTYYSIVKPVAIKGGYSKDDWNLRDPTTYMSLIGAITARENIGTFMLENAKGVTLDGLQIIKPENDFENEIVLVIGLNSEVNINNCIISGNSDNTIYGIVVTEKSSLIIKDSEIIVQSKDSSSSGLFVDNSYVKMTGCNIRMLQNSIATNCEINGIVVGSDSEIIDNKFYISANGIPDVTAINIYDTSLKSTIGKVQGNEITINQFYEVDHIFGIFVDSVSGSYTIDSNLIDVDCDQVGTSCGIFFSKANNNNCFNNVINAGFGTNSICVVLNKSTDIVFKNNSLYVGQCKSDLLAYNKCVCLYENSTADISGNIFHGLSGLNKYSSGILCDTETSSINVLENNVFININNGLVIKDFHNEIYYAANETGLKKLNADFDSNNLFYPTSSDVGISWQGLNPLQPTTETPLEIRESSLASVPTETDILGNPRTLPHSIGAYEID